MSITPITVAYGDGIGPEIMSATLKILEAAKAPIDIDVVEIGKKMYLAGHASGIPDEAWASLSRTRVFLKAPITTPQGGGYKSLNVTIRKRLGLYANVRPCVSLSPYIPTHFPNMSMVIVRENEEDLYAGIEYRQTNDVYQCLKLITRSGSERIVRYAFEYAKRAGRSKVSCFSKDNIMKMTDGLFHQVFNEISQEYPDIESDHYIVDIGTALIAADPERFDVIVTENLYGDIISDVAAQVVGSVGLVGSANIGTNMAMFEAIHGSAPDIAGKKIANPSGLLNAAIQMLLHIDVPDVATQIENAWLKTLEDGVHTSDVFSEASSRQKVNTHEFADAVIARLGQAPSILAAVNYQKNKQPNIVCVDKHDASATQKLLVGVDVFIDRAGISPDELGDLLLPLQGDMQLTVITARGVTVWPGGMPETNCSDHWRCRFVAGVDCHHIQHADIIALLTRLNDAGLDCMKTENLYTFDGEPGYSVA